MYGKAPPLTALALILGTATALAHGDTAPMAVDTTGLPDLPEEMATENPWREADPEIMFTAVEIGAKGYNSNCARCHGLEAISGGLAPDLRYLEANDFGDEWYVDRVLNGYHQNGAVKMPPFGDILSQEAIWAIRTYVETRPDDMELADKQGDIQSYHQQLTDAVDDASAAALAEPMAASGAELEALSGAPKSITALDEAAWLLAQEPPARKDALDALTAALRN
ncbi:Quinohemoprotein alcohol dehydrogenase ADH-IIG (plasmid) [Paracoccus marcusii]|uniref:cytochrome c-550 PedF n=1 Tax=Paracoccus marcusii TaxID=59779 RepID=UPI001C3D0325|nr:cytochrome c-550 PedF [Paracoccus marcusii]QXI65965.1 Quinohemoprotein alcohol dehydrogenase ADH-IIG [Paracoccus marcusii]